jgi:hypothetical protein
MGEGHLALPEGFSSYRKGMVVGSKDFRSGFGLKALDQGVDVDRGEEKLVESVISRYEHLSELGGRGRGLLVGDEGEESCEQFGLGFV